MGKRKGRSYPFSETRKRKKSNNLTEYNRCRKANVPFVPKVQSKYILNLPEEQPPDIKLEVTSDDENLLTEASWSNGTDVDRKKLFTWNKMLDKIDSERLIEEVRRYPALYDQSNEKYRNWEYTDNIWNQISIDLNVVGKPNICKTKWTHIRDQFRKSLKKRRPTPSIYFKKYKYEDVLDFLLPHLTKLDIIPNPSTSQEDCDDYLSKEVLEVTCLPDTAEIKIEEEFISMETPYVIQESSNPLEIHADESFPRPTESKRKTLQHSYHFDKSRSLVEHKKIRKSRHKEELSLYSRQSHNVDAFLSAISPTLKSLRPVLLNQAKTKIFAIVQEMEMEQLMESAPEVMSYSQPQEVYEKSPNSSSVSYSSPSPSRNSPSPSSLGTTSELVR